MPLTLASQWQTVGSNLAKGGVVSSNLIVRSMLSGNYRLRLSPAGLPAGLPELRLSAVFALHVNLQVFVNVQHGRQIAPAVHKFQNTFWRVSIS